MNPEETPVIRLIKKTFEQYLKNKGEDRPVCDSNPLDDWMYYFLYPELSECNMCTRADMGGDMYGRKPFPCWVMSEEQVLRILAESGII